MDVETHTCRLKPRLRSSVAGLIFVAVLALALGGGVGTFAAFTATAPNTGNTAASGTVALTDNDGGGSSPMFSVAGQGPNSVLSRCIKVTAQGSLDSKVRLYAAVAGTGLAPYTGVRITRGTFSGAEPPFPSCTNFSADVSDYKSQGNGVIWTGTLSDLPTDHASGIVDPTAASPESWSANEAHVYKIDLAVADNRGAEGRTATAAFTWEARDSDTGSGSSQYAAEVGGTSGLVGHWRLGETSGTTAADQTANNNDGTYSGGYTLGATGALAGDADKAVTFDDETSQVEVPDSASLDTGNDFTVEAWIKRDPASTGFDVIATKGNWWFGVASATEGNRLTIYDLGNFSAVAESSTPIDDSAWHHVAVTKSGATTKIVLDGVDRTEPANDVTFSNSNTPLFIGNSVDPMDGTLDEVALYSGALSVSELASHYEAGGGVIAPISTYADVVQATSGLQSYWRLGEGSGTTALDSFGTANATYQQGPVLGRPSLVSTGTDSAVGLDGSDARINIGDRYDFAGTAAFSVEGWIKPTTANESAYRRVLSKEATDGGGNQGWALGLYPTSGGVPGEFEFIRIRDGAVNEIQSTTRATPNVRRHLVVTYDGATMRLYVDGTLEASLASSLSLIDTTADFQIGSKSGSGFAALGADVDDFSVYSRALTALEVTGHYDEGA